MRALFQLLFGLTRPVDRRTYAFVGLTLMAVKVSVDLMVLYLATGRPWTPWEYLSLERLTDDVPMWAIRALMAWALPFAWIGLAMSVRRAADAGLSPWVGLFFCLPLVNLLVMVALCLPPTAPPPLYEHPAAPARRAAGLRALGAALLLMIVMVFVGIFGLANLGIVLFAGTPFAMGVVTGFGYNASETRTLGSTLGLAMASVAIGGASLLLFAVEGALCLVMAMPLALPLAVLGALIGRFVAVGPRAEPSPVVLLLIVLPLAAWAEPQFRNEREHSVTTRIEVAAPPAAVWTHLVAFETLAPPEELWFRLGIAHPTRARILGRGVGAVRYCEFSTGAFVEPITVWDEPRRLAFDVASQPEPLRELSPYPYVRINHLEGSIRVHRGEFRLSPSAGGGTVLEGTTWYDLSLFPEAYWTLWSDAMIHAIHLRVLRHIRSEVEGAAGHGPAAP